MYLFWAILNLALLVYFGFTCIEVTRLLKSKIGLFAAVVFVFGFLSFSCNSYDDYKEDQSKVWESPQTDTVNSNATGTTTVYLAHNIISKYKLIIKYKQDQSTKLIIPVTAYTSFDGAEMSTIWKPSFVAINPTRDS